MTKDEFNEMFKGGLKRGELFCLKAGVLGTLHSSRSLSSDLPGIRGDAIKLVDKLAKELVE